VSELYMCKILLTATNANSNIPLYLHK
jgi:hypothetical protein